MSHKLFWGAFSVSHILQPDEILHTSIIVLDFLSRKFAFQLHKNILLELISRKLHSTYSFATLRITWKQCWGIIFLENRVSVTQNVFGVSVRVKIITGSLVVLEITVSVTVLRCS